MEKKVVVEQRNQVGIITINTNSGLNIIDRQTLKDLGDSCVSLDMDDSVKVIIIRGSDKSFSAGLDANEFANQCSVEMLQEMYQDFDKIATLKKPAIAAVNGYVIGIGLEIALACDMVFASDNASFGVPDLSLGIVPGFGATQRLPKAVGKSKAMEMILTGRAMSAKEAESVGLVSRIIPLAYLFTEAYNTAEKISSLRDMAINAAKELVKTAVSNIGLEEGLDIERQLYQNAVESDDFNQNLLKIAKK